MEQRVAEYAPGDVVFEEGDKGRSMYVLLEGQVELTKRAEDGSHLLKCVDAKNDFFGEMSLIDAQPRSATATATAPSKLLVVNDATFEQLVRSNGDFAIKLIRVLAARLRETNRALSEAAATAPKDRFIHGMIDFAVKHGEPMYDGGVKINIAAMQDWVNTHVGLSRKQINALTYKLTKDNQIPFAPTSARTKECLVLSKDFMARNNRRRDGAPQ